MSPQDSRLDHALQAVCDAQPPGHPALTDEEDAVSYAELDTEAGRIADLLTAAGHRPDEPVLVPVSNRARDLLACFAVWRAGGVAVPVHRTTPGPAAERLLARTGAAWVIFTSGSTGEPKGVVHDHGTFLAKLGMIDGVLGYGDDERVLVVLQLSFIFAQWVAMLTLLRGGTVVLHEKFEAEKFLAALGSGVTRVAMVPTMMRALRLHPSMETAAPFAGVVMSGGEVLDAPLGQWLRDRWPDAEVWDIYGLTETATTDFVVGPEDGADAAGTIGRAAPGIEFRLAEADGELLIRSPHVMRGYFGAPELTAAAFDDGYFRTGDLARVLDSGLVELVGRSTDTVNRGGNKIAPLEVERVYLGHAEVVAALAAGVDHAVKGEELHLLVVLAAGAEATAESLRQWGRDRLERYKVPDAIHVADALPQGPTGKADRRALRQVLSG